MEHHFMPEETAEQRSEHVIEVSCWCKPEIVELDFENIQVWHRDVVVEDD